MEDSVEVEDWEPIKDLPEEWAELASKELRALAGVWQDQRRSLESSETLRQFNERLNRQWAIDTGILERLYSLDRGITQTLIDQGIDAALIPHDSTDRDPQLVAAIIQDQQATVEGLFDFVKGRRILSVGYVKELHALLTRNQHSFTVLNQFGLKYEKELSKGKYKSLPNDPTRPDGGVHRYCPPEQVASEMDQLVSLHLAHQKLEVAPEVQSAWLHHRFTQIHPFEDGNGRVARALASLVFIRAGWFPLAVSSEDAERGKYIDALEAADRGSLGELVDLFSAIQKRTFVNALSIATEVVARKLVDQVIDAAREMFESRRKELEHQWKQAKKLADELNHEAEQQLAATAAKLETQLGQFSKNFRFRADKEPSGGRRGYWFRLQMIHAAKQLGFYANPTSYVAWTRLTLDTEQHAEILVLLQGLGHEYRGVVACSMVFFRRDESSDGAKDITDLVTVSDGYFQVNYRDEPAESKARFEGWVRQGLVQGLEVWRRGL
ncbi:MAG: Fic family protein [Actinomycetota bacterium]